MTTEGFTPQLSHSTPSSNALKSRAIGIAARAWGREAIAHALSQMRAWLCDYVRKLNDEQLAPPMRATINPPLWEAAHVAWFAEWFCVREATANEYGVTIPKGASSWPESDTFLNSNTIAHDARWRLPQLTRETTLSYLQSTLDAALDALSRCDENDARSIEKFRWAMFHEAMHLEAFAWTAQTLAWPAPRWVATMFVDSFLRNNSNALNPIDMGQDNFSQFFRFDNEIGLLPQLNRALAAGADLISNAQFAAFVESGEYTKTCGQSHPSHWRKRTNGDWEARRFNRWSPLDGSAPMIHVNAFEAEAYAAWKGARLPTEAELHALFSENPSAWHGHVWEWTSTSFATYDSDTIFEPGLYREYSQPWFDGKHRVLRGGSLATLPIMHHPHYRNFFTPNRSDVFAGFRIVHL